MAPVQTRRTSERPSSILVVDDNEMNRTLLMRRLNKLGYEAALVDNGSDALDLIRQRAFDMVLLDIMMPAMDGYEVLERMKNDPLMNHIPVIMITALDDVASAARCIEAGAEDYLTKPFDSTLLKARIGSSLERKRLHDAAERYRQHIERNNHVLEEQVERQVREISTAQMGAIFAMSKLAESRDPETGEHLERMREYCKILAQHMAKLPDYRDIITPFYIDSLYAASPLHDIGKVGVVDEVLLKPDKLTAEEWDRMKLHTVIGAETLREVDRQHPGNGFVRMGIEIAESHHEKWDGSGYPYGLSGTEIPLSARILALGDVYDALTSKRCYKEAFDHERSRLIIEAGIGRHFDPVVVDAFLSVEDDFKRIREEYQDSEKDLQAIMIGIKS